MERQEHTDPGACPRCGSNNLNLERETGSVAVRISEREELESPNVVITRAVCNGCGLFVNDDLNSSVARAFDRIYQRTRRRVTDASYDALVTTADSLSETADSEIQQAFKQIQESWSAHGVMIVTRAELKSVLEKLATRNATEGFRTVTTAGNDGRVLDILFRNDSNQGRMCRVYKAANSSFAMFGHVSLYRLLGAIDRLDSALLQYHRRAAKRWWQVWK